MSSYLRLSCVVSCALLLASAGFAEEPRLSPEVVVSGGQSGIRRSPSLASDGRGVYVAWMQLVGTNRAEIYGAILDGAGRVSVAPHLLSSTAMPYRPDVAFDGSAYRVAWMERCTDCGSYGRLATVLVGRNGEVGTGDLSDVIPASPVEMACAHGRCIATTSGAIVRFDPSISVMIRSQDAVPPAITRTNGEWALVSVIETACNSSCFKDGIPRRVFAQGEDLFLEFDYLNIGTAFCGLCPPRDHMRDRAAVLSDEGAFLLIRPTWVLTGAVMTVDGEVTKETTLLQRQVLRVSADRTGRQIVAAFVAQTPPAHPFAVSTLWEVRAAFGPDLDQPWKEILLAEGLTIEDPPDVITIDDRTAAIAYAHAGGSDQVVVRFLSFLSRSRPARR